MAPFTFDVATVDDDLQRTEGRRDISRPRWSRVVVSSHSLVDAHLTAAQMCAARGLVIDVLYRK